MELSTYKAFYLKKIFKWLRVFTIFFITDSAVLIYFLYEKSFIQSENITHNSENFKFDKNRNGCN
jgi:uncharacterized protein YrrD